jgi:hypothetical protein
MPLCEVCFGPRGEWRVWETGAVKQMFELGALAP